MIFFGLLVDGRFGPHLKVPPSQYRFNCLVTTYETILTDSEYLGAVPWKVLIIDEAHRLKNANSKLSRQLRDFRFDFATLLTGTPIQNNLMELFTLLNFLEPQEFSSQEEFEEQFGNVQDSEQVDCSPPYPSSPAASCPAFPTSTTRVI